MRTSRYLCADLVGFLKVFNNVFAPLVENNKLFSNNALSFGYFPDILNQAVYNNDCITDSGRDDWETLLPSLNSLNFPLSKLSPNHRPKELNAVMAEK